MSGKRWNYSGDINVEEGGFYWKEDGADDYVLAVRVTPCADAGGPSNLFWIESGSVYLGDKVKQDSSLSIIGVEPGEATRRDYVEAALAYGGVEPDYYNGRLVVQIGKPQEASDSWQWGGAGDVDVQLRGNASLARYIRAEFLR